MKILREIKTVRQQRILVELPASFKSKRVEILVFPIENEEEKSDSPERFMQFVKDNTLTLPANYRFEREKLHER